MPKVCVKSNTNLLNEHLRSICFRWVLAAALLSCLVARSSAANDELGWFSWRGPEQTGISREAGLPARIDPENPLWRADFPGASTPVIAHGRLFVMGYLGAGADLQEGVACFDAETGKAAMR